MAYDFSQLLNPARPLENRGVLFFGTPAHQAMLYTLRTEGYDIEIAASAAAAKKAVEHTIANYKLLIVSWSAEPKDEGNEILKLALRHFPGKIVVITSDRQGWKDSDVIKGQRNIEPVFIAVNRNYGQVTRQTRQTELETLTRLVRENVKPTPSVQPGGMPQP